MFHFISVMCLNFSLSSKLTEIRLNIISDCADSAELGWTVFTTDDSLASLFNCSLVANKKPPLKPKLYQQFLTLPMHGLYTLEDKLLGGEQYWFKIKCGDIVSNIVLLTALGKCIQRPAWRKLHIQSDKRLDKFGLVRELSS